MLAMLLDRKKDLVKLQAGEYVSLGKVETSLKLCPLVDNLCLYAESSKMFTVALVVPNRKNLEGMAQRVGIVDAQWPELCDHPAVEENVLSQLRAHGLKCNVYSLLSHTFLEFIIGSKSLACKYSMWQKSGLNAFCYNSAKCEPIWMKSGVV